MIIKLIVLSCIVFLIGCKPAADPAIRLYYAREYSYHGLVTDTIEAKSPDYHDAGDSLFFKKELVFNGQVHELRKYSNMPYCAMDAGQVCYELDSLGVIFYMSLDWVSTKELVSSSDSLNEILHFAIARALIYSEVDLMKNGYYENKNRRRTITFKDETGN